MTLSDSTPIFAWMVVAALGVIAVLWVLAEKFGNKSNSH